jgi:hypothetical protein
VIEAFLCRHVVRFYRVPDASVELRADFVLGTIEGSLRSWRMDQLRRR